MPARPLMFPSDKAITPAKVVTDISKVPVLLPYGWERAEQDLLEMLARVQKSYNTDAKGLYISGISYGGFGTWYMAGKPPDLFAAAAPVVAWGHPDATYRQSEAAIVGDSCWP